MLKKLREIINGYYHLLFSNKEQYQIDRLRICKECPMKKGLLCGECGCLIVAKTASKISHCPLQKWNSDKFIDDFLNSL